jgi:hypothetical protein
MDLGVLLEKGWNVLEKKGIDKRYMLEIRVR